MSRAKFVPSFDIRNLINYYTSHFSPSHFFFVLVFISTLPDPCLFARSELFSELAKELSSLCLTSSARNIALMIIKSDWLDQLMTFFFFLQQQILISSGDEGKEQEQVTVDGGHPILQDIHLDHSKNFIFAASPYKVSTFLSLFSGSTFLSILHLLMFFLKFQLPQRKEKAKKVQEHHLSSSFSD